MNIAIVVVSLEKLHFSLLFLVVFCW